MFEKNTDSNFKAQEKNLKVELKSTAEKVKQDFKTKLSKDKFYHDIVSHKIYTESVNEIGKSLVDPMWEKMQEDIDTKISDLKSQLDVENRINAAISVSMAQTNQIMEMKNNELAKKQTDIMQSLESKVKKQFESKLDETHK